MSEQQDLDTQLMLRFQAGDVACFEQLVDRNKQRVFNLVYRFLGGRQDAEDLAQEVFIRVYCAAPRYQPTAKFTTWLYVICRNVCLKAVERRRHDAVAQRDDPEFMREVTAHHEATNNTETPLHAAIRGERAMQVRAAINALPPPQRLVVVLYRYEHLDYEEIASVTQSTVSAVKSLLHRAKVALRDRLQGTAEIGETPTAHRD